MPAQQTFSIRAKGGENENEAKVNSSIDGSCTGTGSVRDLRGGSSRARALTGCNFRRRLPNPNHRDKTTDEAEEVYCLLYPAEYSTTIPKYIVINPITTPGDLPGDAWLYIATTDVSGRTAGQIADENIAAAGAGFNITRFEVEVDGEQAVVVDGLPGLDSVRNVFIVHNERLYNLFFMPWFPNTAEPTQLENLYVMVMDTLHFLP